MDKRSFTRALVVQGALVLALFALLAALPLPEDFFRNWGYVTGPVAWTLCALATARILGLPVPFTLFCALAGGVAGALVFLAATHWAGMVAALLVFAASCAGYPAFVDERTGR
ncbi:hypothetical protein JDY09_00615 [Thermoleophilum album]|uniref:hypothetical protein n=1 Tax=Thermoleophilum album TaxID=29539 RepID=UPI00237CC464|nr:hypothetical protein [Thermoleophilum album]WDT93800.1 hypothetical protein JDY09_00615 [Thermoleophilum album]